MGLDAGYSKAASRRIAVWEATNHQAAAQIAADGAAQAASETVQQAASDAAKPKFEVLVAPVKVAEPSPTPPSPNNATQMSTEMLDKLLSMVSDLSDRFLKQEGGINSALNFLTGNKKATEGLTEDVAALSGKLGGLVDDLASLSGRFDEFVTKDKTVRIENPIADETGPPVTGGTKPPAIDTPAADAQPNGQASVQSVESAKTSAAVTLSTSDPVSDKTTVISSSAQATPLDPRLAALTA